MQRRVKNYMIINQIGSGSFGNVFKASAADGEIFALKEIEAKAGLDKYIRTELDIVEEKLSHPNIVQIYEHFVDDSIYIAMEYCSLGDLSGYIVGLKKEPDIKQRINFMSQIALGVNYLHSQNIIHRDLKPENVLVTIKNEQITCKITDFGISRIKLRKYDTFHTQIGTPLYMAPEITGDQEYSSEVDVFALGILFYAVYRNTILPYNLKKKALIPGVSRGDTIAYLNRIVKEEKPTVEEFIEKYFTKSNIAVGKLIYSMIHIKPQNRPRMKSVVVQITEIKVKQELNATIESHERSIKDLKTQNEELRNELSDLHESSEKERLEYSMKQKQMEGKKNQDKVTSLQKQIGAMSMERNSLREKLKNCKQELERLQEKTEKNRKTGNDDIEKKELLIVNLKAEIVEYQHALLEAEELTKNILKENDVQIKEIQESIKAKEKVICDYEERSIAQLEELRCMQQKHTQKEQSLQRKIEEQDAVNDKLKQQITDLQKEAEAKNEIINKLNKQIISYDSTEEKLSESEVKEETIVIKENKIFYKVSEASPKELKAIM